MGHPAYHKELGVQLFQKIEENMEAKRPEISNILGKMKSSYEHYKPTSEDQT
jgi:hypothetical protein